MSTLYGFDYEEVEQVELRIMDMDHFVSEEELASALASSSLKGFNIIKHENHSKPKQPCFILEKNVTFGRVHDEESCLSEIFPGACTRQMFQQLTRDCKGKFPDEQSCVFGVEVYALGKQRTYKVCPILRMDTEGY